MTDNSQDYRYAASDDLLPAWRKNFTSRIGDGTGDSEEEYLATVKLLVACKSNANCLDIGCGLGRLIELIKDDIGTFVGLEPDLARYRDCFKNYDDGGRIQIVHATSSEYKAAQQDARFDLITLSMVLQHVATNICDQILHNVHDLLTPDGMAIVATTLQPVERFTLQHDPSARSIESFDQYALDTSNQNWGIPVRYFSKASFHDVLQQAGLKIVRWGQFSYYRLEKLAWFSAALWYSVRGAPRRRKQPIRRTQACVPRMTLWGSRNARTLSEPVLGFAKNTKL